MSTAFFVFLAIIIIFWHPPFQTPEYFKRIFRPLVLIILTAMLIFIGAVNSLTKNDQNKIDTAKIESKIHSCNGKMTK
ncbi:hypothetical protein H8E88_26520 [candidate division KSB1 bacterium]|nr:hypothetical protein [candidate division KSB1 bacterium]MBL7095761.1 hypothetical protein [candidate division KSB1 bacterium]